MSVHFHLCKENIVVDSPKRLSRGSVAHVDEEMKELVKDIHGLARFELRCMII